MDFCQDALVFLSSAALRVTDDPADPADPAPRLASKTCFLTGTLGVPAGLLTRGHYLMAWIWTSAVYGAHVPTSR